MRSRICSVVSKRRANPNTRIIFSGGGFRMQIRYAARSVVNLCKRRANPVSAYAPDAGIGRVLQGEKAVVDVDDDEVEDVWPAPVPDVDVVVNM